MNENCLDFLSFSCETLVKLRIGFIETVTYEFLRPLTNLTHLEIDSVGEQQCAWLQKKKKKKELFFRSFVLAE